MSETTLRHTLPYIMPSQAQKHVTHNEALRQIDVLSHLTLKGLDTNTPPQNPIEGDAYAIGAAPEGGFANYTGYIAAFVDGAWMFYPQVLGMIAFDETAESLIVRATEGWAPVSAQAADNLASLGINTIADNANRLAVKSNAVLFAADDQSQDANPDIRLSLNKSVQSGTASLLFQDAYSGRAEIGLAGDDKFRIKVSDTGSDFKTALEINPVSGHLGIGSAPANVLDVRENVPGKSRMSLTNLAADPNSGSELRLTAANSKWLSLAQYNNAAGYLISNSTSFIYRLTGNNAAHRFHLGNNEALRITENRIEAKAPLKLASYAIANLPVGATSDIGGLIFVPDAPSGPTAALFTGSQWISISSGNPL